MIAIILLHAVALVAACYFYWGQQGPMCFFYLGAACLVVLSLRARRWFFLSSVGAVTTALLIFFARLSLPVSLLWSVLVVWPLYIVDQDYGTCDRDLSRQSICVSLLYVVLLLFSLSHIPSLSSLASICVAVFIVAGMIFAQIVIENDTVPDHPEKESGQREPEVPLAEQEKKYGCPSEPSSRLLAEDTVDKPKASPLQLKKEKYAFLNEPPSRAFTLAAEHIRLTCDEYPEEIQPSLASIADSIEKIVCCMEEDPSERESARRFLRHFLPSVFSIADKHARLALETREEGCTLHQALESSRFMLERLKKAFAKKHYKMLNSKIADLSVEINTLDTMLKIQGC